MFRTSLEVCSIFHSYPPLFQVFRRSSHLLSLCNFLAKKLQLPGTSSPKAPHQSFGVGYGPHWRTEVPIPPVPLAALSGNDLPLLFKMDKNWCVDSQENY